MSSNARPHRSTSSRHGRSQATDKSAPGRSPLSKDTQPGTTEEEPAQPMELEPTKDESEDGQNESAAKQNTGEDMKGYLSKDYRDLLNSTIEEAAGTSRHASGDLDPSYIGSSYWTSEEKTTFFQGLAINGRDDLPGISSVVRTKSQIEVRSYLMALKNACSGDQIQPPDSYSTSSTLTAWEMGDRCERAIELTAEALERYVLRRDTEREKQKFGKLWLIDDEMATQIELHQQQKSLAAAIDDDEKAVVAASDDSNAESESHSDRINIQCDAPGDAPEDPPRIHTISSADLLKPEAFLTLSRSLFMNNAMDAEANWRRLGTGEGEPIPPAMFRSAFDNFGTIAINLTRWVVQAAMFQAVSRLRAKDEQNPTAIVTTEDAKTAIEFLNLHSDWKKYWAGVARRCRVKVYSGSDKYWHSRPGTKNGRLLSYDEVETELGFPPSEILGDLKNDDEGIKRESSTSIPSDEMNEASEQGSESSDGDDEQSDVQSNPSPSGKAKRKRSASVSSDEDEDLQLNIADEQASRAEERRLMKMLRYAVSPSPEPRAGGDTNEKGSSLSKRITLDQQKDWRSGIDYIAAWEHQRIMMETECDKEHGQSNSI